MASAPSERVLQLLKKANLICFDVDSTFCTDESIDELAAFVGKGAEVAAMTRRAMGGSVLFQDALKMRLDAMDVSERQVQQFKREHPPKLSPGIKDLVKLLQKRRTAVALVSGGFRQIIEPIADELGIPLSHVHANNLKFDQEGSYAGFDEGEFTSRTGGKAEACKHLKAAHGYETVLMIGDGATDAEAVQPGGADAFICYGGVVLRADVAAKADWVITDVNRIIEVLQS